MPLIETSINKTYYEVHGEEGSPALVMGGWGTFCHGQHAPVPRSLMSEHRVVMFDYPAIGASGPDSHDTPTSAEWATEVVAALLDHIDLGPVHVVGMIGLGGCIGQELAIARPDLVRSLFMAGTWAKPDPVLYDQVDGLRAAFVGGGFEVFQMLAGSLSFDPDFYNENRDAIIGPDGAWSDLRGRASAVSKIVDVCLSHDSIDRLGEIRCPSLVVHGGRDLFTGPRLTSVLEEHIPGAIGCDWPELAHIPSGGEQKQRFDRILSDFLRSIDA